MSPEEKNTAATRSAVTGNNAACFGFNDFLERSDFSYLLHAGLDILGIHF